MKKDIDLEKLRDWARHVTKGQKDSAVFMSLWNDKTVDDPVPIMQLGYSLILDKPIVVIAPIGSTVPENLKRAAQVIEYFHPEDEASLQAAVLRAFTTLEITLPH